MKSVRTFSASGSYGSYVFEILAHGGLFYLNLNGSRIARSDSKEKLDCYIDGFMLGTEKGYRVGCQLLTKPKDDDDPNMPISLKEKLQEIIDSKLGEIITMVKNELSESEPDHRIIRALKRYFS